MANPLLGLMQRLQQGLGQKALERRQSQLPRRAQKNLKAQGATRQGNTIKRPGRSDIRMGAAPGSQRKKRRGALSALLAAKGRMDSQMAQTVQKRMGGQRQTIPGGENPVRMGQRTQISPTELQRTTMGQGAPKPRRSLGQAAMKRTRARLGQK